MVIAGPSNFVPRFVNSLIIGFGSTFLAVFLSITIQGADDVSARIYVARRRQHH